MADTGREALQILESGNFDLMLLDLLLPDVDGMKILSSLRTTHAAHRPRRVIVVSAIGNLIAIEPQVMELGADAVMSKPFRIDNLKDVIDKTGLLSNG